MSTAGPPPDDDRPPHEEGQVVDPEVLAERRARRAELAEETLLARANRAEQDRVLLATRLAEAERALHDSERERETLAAELSRRERDLRAAEQREFAEQQRRVELEDEAVLARREARDELDGLRRRVRAAEQREEELARELDAVRRAAETGHASASGAAEVGADEELERIAAERTLLRHELDRRVAEQETLAARVAELEAERARMGDELGEARDALVSARDALAGARDLAAAPQVDAAALEQALRDADDARRVADEATAARDALAEEMRRREGLEAIVRTGIDELRERLERAVRGEEERSAREAAIAALAAELAAVASDLRVGVQHALADAVARARAEEHDRVAADLAAVEERLAELRGHLRTSVEQLEERLTAERAAREEAEAALARAREAHRGAEARAEELRREAEALREEGDALRDEGEAPRDEREVAGASAASVPARPAPPEIPAHLLGGEAAGGDTSSLIADLERAADRLRAQVEGTEASTPPPTAEVSARDGERPPASRHARRAAEARSPAVGVELAPRKAVRSDPSWLRAALDALARTDPGAAAEAIAAFAPAAAARTRRRIAYDLFPAEGDAWRVTLADGRGEARPRAAADGEGDFAVEGPVAALLPFAAGGVPRRLDVRVSGSRRRLRRLRRALRAPMGLAELRAAEVAADPGALLRVLVAAVPPEATVDQDVAVTYDVGGDRGGVWHVRVEDGAAHVGSGEAPGSPALHARVRCTDRALPALLAGIEPPRGPRPTADGSLEAVALVHGWFDQVQGRA